MVFIKGAWIELWPGDERFYDYFCCPEWHCVVHQHHEEFNPATGIGEKHDPPMWVTVHCDLAGGREIPFNEEDYLHGRIIRPDWCPLRRPPVE
jgi:hypothetical protein